jgi:hypothetical protein
MGSLYVSSEVASVGSCANKESGRKTGKKSSLKIFILK